MNYIKTKYGNPPVMITENGKTPRSRFHELKILFLPSSSSIRFLFLGTAGMDDPNNQLTPIKDALKDQKRIKYHNDYLTNLLAAIK